VEAHFLALLEIKGLKVGFKTQAGLVHAVDEIDLSLVQGEIVGLAGESGSGKSTLGYSIMKILPRNALVQGSINFDGIELLTLTQSKLEEIRGKRIAMVFQGSMNSLNPLMRVEEQVAEPMILHQQANEKQAVVEARNLLELVGVDKEKGRHYPHELSGGLKQRVAIAMALSTHPALLIADEPTTALDVMTQAQIMRLLGRIRDEFKITILMISHDLALLSETCDRLILMYAGKIAEIGSRDQIVRNPRHPYTQGLLGSIPSVRNIGRASSSIPGDPPDPLNPPAGCRFKPRCSFAKDVCSTFEKGPLYVEDGHYAACVLVGG
jgi:peptide/nickel transport system ATP-binding protein